MQYIMSYTEIIDNMKQVLEFEPQVYVEDDAISTENAITIATDLKLSCIHNKVLCRYYFRTAPYKRLTINETFIH